MCIISIILIALLRIEILIIPGMQVKVKNGGAMMGTITNVTKSASRNQQARYHVTIHFDDGAYYFLNIYILGHSVILFIFCLS